MGTPPVVDRNVQKYLHCKLKFEFNYYICSMTKQQIIERYGIEWYNNLMAKNRERYKGNEEHKAKQRVSRRNYYARNKNKYSESQKEYQRLKKENDVDWYKNHKADCCRRNTLRYINDEEYRARHIEFATLSNKKRYVEGGKVELIENYELAKANRFKGWDIHHRLELHPDGSIRFTRKSLIELGLYYNRPAHELIWIDRTEHHKIHSESRRMNKRI